MGRCFFVRYQLAILWVRWRSLLLSVIILYKRLQIQHSIIRDITMSPVYFLERPLVRKTRVPHLVDHLGGVYVVAARRPRHDGLDRPHPHAVLELLCQRPVAACHGLSCPSALAAEH